MKPHVFIAWRRRMARRGLVLLFGSLLLAGCSFQEDSSAVPLPPLTVSGLESGELQLSTLTGKVTVLNAWAPWCPPCLEEMPSLERLHQQLDPERFRVIGLTTDDRFLALEFLQKHAISFDNYFIDQAELESQLGVKAFPETLIIGADGLIAERVLGERDWASAEIRAWLEELARDTASTPAP